MLEKIGDKDLRVFTVWVPILERDVEQAVPNAVKLMPDNRVSHFWDAQGELVKGFASALAFKESQPAWDVYFVYNRDVEWKNAPPVPTFWMTKLRVAPERKFDGEAFKREVEKAINREAGSKLKR